MLLGKDAQACCFATQMPAAGENCRVFHQAARNAIALWSTQILVLFNPFAHTGFLPRIATIEVSAASTRKAHACRTHQFEQRDGHALDLLLAKHW